MTVYTYTYFCEFHTILLYTSTSGHRENLWCMNPPMGLEFSDAKFHVALFSVRIWCMNPPTGLEFILDPKMREPFRKG